MTESEAIKELQENIDLPFGSNVSKEATKMAIQALEKQIRKTSVRTKEIVYRFSVLSDRDKDRIISKFQSIKYSKEQNIEILLDQLAQNRLEEEFLNTIKSYREDIMALEKQIPKKPTYEGDGYAPDGTFIYDTWICPCCDKRYEVDYDDYGYCPNCGQKIDWSDEE